MKPTNKTKWASVRMTPTGSVALCLNSNDLSSCLYFENTEELAEAIKKRHLSIKNWIISIPDSLCITKSIELPASDIAQAHKMLEFELSSYLPLPTEELVYGSRFVSKNEGLLKVLVYILKVNILEDILAKYKSIGIRPSKVMIDSVAVQSWFGQDKNRDVAQIDLLFGDKHLFAATAKDGSFRRYDEISLQGRSFENQRELITEEIKHLLAEISTDKHQPVLKIAARGDIKPKIENWFNGDFQKIEFMELPKLNSFSNGTFPKNDLTFEFVLTSGLIKAAEDPDFIFLNLLPRNVLKKARQKQVIINVAVTAVLGVFLVFCLWFNFAAMNWRIQRASQKIIKEITPIKHIAEDVESKRQKVKAIQAQLSNRRQISEIFSQLYEYSPTQISISKMTYLSKGNTASVNIKGQADTLSNAFEYSDAMKDSKLLNNIQIINAQQIPRPGGSIVEFKAECTMRGN